MDRRHQGQDANEHLEAPGLVPGVGFAGGYLRVLGVQGRVPAGAKGPGHRRSHRSGDLHLLVGCSTFIGSLWAGKREETSGAKDRADIPPEAGAAPELTSSNDGEPASPPGSTGRARVAEASPSKGASFTPGRSRCSCPTAGRVRRRLPRRRAQRFRRRHWRNPGRKGILGGRVARRAKVSPWFGTADRRHPGHRRPRRECQLPERLTKERAVEDTVAALLNALGGLTGKASACGSRGRRQAKLMRREDSSSCERAAEGADRCRTLPGASLAL